MIASKPRSFRIGIGAPTLGAALVTVLAACGNPQASATADADEAPQVHTASGEVRGFVDHGIAVFRGIPFAGNVSGEARWRPPAPAPHWDGVREAHDPGPICPQSTNPRSSNMTTSLAEYTIAEDCLNLSVYSPSLTPDMPAPVMVWVHGGGARFGTGSRYDGHALAERGVVLVTLNYRLDRLGLFAHPALSSSQPDEPLANYGLMDVAAGLRWVRDNIDAFGGDPGNVTLFGQSSGAVAVTSLMVSPLTEGLYHRAIAQSGSASVDQPTWLSKSLPGAPSLESDGEAMAAELGIDPAGDVPAQLRALPWQSIIEYTDARPANALVPVIDGRVIPDNVGRLFAAGRNHPTPFLTGTTSWEQSLIAKFNLPLPAVLRGIDPAEARAAYPGMDDPALAGEWFADSLFHALARYLAGQSARQQQPTYVYRFDHVGADKSATQPGAAHGDDVDYVFGSLDDNANDSDHAMAATVADYWTRFAHTGDPNGPGLPTWPAYDDRDQAVMLLDDPARVEAGLHRQAMRYHHDRYQPIVTTP